MDDMLEPDAKQPVDVTFPPWGLFIFESHHSARFFMPPTRADYLKVVYVLKGAGWVESPRLKVDARVEAGDLVVVPPRVRHAFRDEPGTGAAYIVLCVQRSVFRLCESLPGRPGRPAVVRNDALTQEADRLLRRLFFEQYLRRTACGEMMIGLAVQLLATVARAQVRMREGPKTEAAPRTPHEVRVQAYIRDLEDRYFVDEKIDNVATRLGMSRRSFTDAFRRLTQASWLTYLRALRVRKAKALLLSADHTMLWVALESGFQDVSTFHRAFRAVESMSPAQWKEAHRPARPSPGWSLREADPRPPNRSRSKK